MKIFLYKALTVCVLFIIVFQFSIGAVQRKINKSLVNIQTKENLEQFKDKIREEISKGIKKEKILNQEDKILINNLIEKIKKELKTN
jgi:hypothetical protein|tara:strand:+ start:631 stop:891 length:261 start_codon:yes stop_codon:yes gene_type:complete